MILLLIEFLLFIISIKLILLPSNFCLLSRILFLAFDESLDIFIFSLSRSFNSLLRLVACWFSSLLLIAEPIISFSKIFRLTLIALCLLSCSLIKNLYFSISILISPKLISLILINSLIFKDELIKRFFLSFSFEISLSNFMRSTLEILLIFCSISKISCFVYMADSYLFGFTLKIPLDKILLESEKIKLFFLLVDISDSFNILKSPIRL